MNGDLRVVKVCVEPGPEVVAVSHDSIMAGEAPRATFHAIGLLAKETSVPNTKIAATVGMNQPGRACALQQPDGD
jgi:hypothetical protein